MKPYENWTDEEIWNGWWDAVAGYESVIVDKALLARFYGLPVGTFGETRGVPEPCSAEDRDRMEIIIEAFSRVCKMPSSDYGKYIGPKLDERWVHRTSIAWAIQAVYNLGFESAVTFVKENPEFKPSSL